MLLTLNKKIAPLYFYSICKIIRQMKTYRGYILITPHIYPRAPNEKLSLNESTIPSILSEAFKPLPVNIVTVVSLSEIFPKLRIFYNLFNT